MSSITICNLAPAAELDRKAMAAIRGGTGFGSPSINVNVPINVNQENNMVQNTSVLNNSVIGAGAFIPGLTVSPTQWAMNSVSLPAPAFPAQLA